MPQKTRVLVHTLLPPSRTLAPVVDPRVGRASLDPHEAAARSGKPHLHLVPGEVRVGADVGLHVLDLKKHRERVCDQSKLSIRT